MNEEGVGGIDRPRKRQRKPENYPKNVAKHKRNSGLSYTTKKGATVNAKVFRDIDCQCKMKCHGLISVEERRSLHKQFWDIGDFGTQNAYLCGNVQHSDVVRLRARDGSRPPRTFMNQYFLSFKNNTIHVCKKFFLDTFQISDGRLCRVLAKFRAGISPGNDQRGKKVNPRRVPQQELNFVKEHIQSFPSYESHYTRAHNPNKKYLNESLDLRKMYDLYKQWCAERQVIPVKESFYRHVFNTKFNLSFHKPSKDTCKTCDVYKIRLSDPTLSDGDRNKIETDHELHLRKAERARESMKADKELAMNDPDIYVICIDLQKALPFPILSVSDAYYKRNMYVYNCGVHVLATEKGFFYVWDESKGSRGSQEIAACVLNHFHQFCMQKKHIIIYSDTATGQNRNIKIALALMTFLQSQNHVQVIEQKFLISGHSYLPNDRDFGSVEQSSKGKTIFVPTDWYSIMASARRRNSFIITEMHHLDFFSTELLEKAITKRKKSSEGDKVNWFKIQCIRYERAHQYIIFYKESLNDVEEFKTLDIAPSRAGRPNSLASIAQPLLYPDGRQVSALKKRDMHDLLQFIPPVHHSFFTNILAGPIESAPVDMLEEDVDEPEAADVVLEDLN